MQRHQGCYMTDGIHTSEIGRRLRTKDDLGEDVRGQQLENLLDVNRLPAMYVTKV